MATSPQERLLHRLVLFGGCNSLAKDMSATDSCGENGLGKITAVSFSVDSNDDNSLELEKSGPLESCSMTCLGRHWE